MTTERAHAARLGMWVFLSSEVLLFSVLFTLYIAARARYPHVFHYEIHEHAEKVLGSLNTAILLVSSTLVASAVHAQRENRYRRMTAFVLGTAFLGVCFLGIKATEYIHHAESGIVPGRGMFWTLYYTMTGLHAVHVMIGVCALVLVCRTERETLLENVALYWHLVDLIWIFLWPLFYLA